MGPDDPSNPQRSFVNRRTQSLMDFASKSLVITGHEVCMVDRLKKALNDAYERGSKHGYEIAKGLKSE